MNQEIHTAKLVSITPRAEENIVYMARVSNPQNQNNNETAPRLIKYLLKHKHYSPFEMASMQIEIETTRAVAAQVLRHRSFSFQEFCLAGNARITVSNGAGGVQRLAIEELYQKWDNSRFRARYARSYDESVGRFIEAPILSVYESGEKPVYRFRVGKRTIDCTREHRVLTKERGFVEFGEAYDNGLTIALNGASAEPLPYQDPKVLADNATQGKRYGWTLGMTAKWGKIDSQVYLGIQMTYDIEMDHPTHNFVADGIVVHNSQRYSSVDQLGTVGIPHLRSQDLKNKQASHDDLDPAVVDLLSKQIATLYNQTYDLYEYMLHKGVAKECARSILPLGTPTRLYMSGSVRSWLHYIQIRAGEETQLEHRLIAEACKDIFKEQLPNVFEAAFGS